MLRVIAIVLLLAAPATAEPFVIGSRPAWFVTAGATGGGTVTEDRAAFVGGELGLVRVIDNRILGLYTDAYYDFGVDGTYMTFGPELGLIRRSRALPIALGIDGGAVVRFAGERAYGATGRVFVGVAGSLGLFARYAYVDADSADHVVQIGMTFKFPLGSPFGAAARRR